VGLGRGGSSSSLLRGRPDPGRRLVTRIGRGGGPIILVDGRLGGCAVSLPEDPGKDERAKGSSRLGGSAASAVSGRL
jgi:hypothetical protein